MISAQNAEKRRKNQKGGKRQLRQRRRRLPEGFRRDALPAGTTRAPKRRKRRSKSKKSHSHLKSKGKAARRRLLTSPGAVPVRIRHFPPQTAPAAEKFHCSLRYLGSSKPFWVPRGTEVAVGEGGGHQPSAWEVEGAKKRPKITQPPPISWRRGQRGTSINQFGRGPALGGGFIESPKKGVWVKKGRFGARWSRRLQSPR